MKKIMFAVWFGLIVVSGNAEDKMHVVKAGESLYSIARMYNVSVTELKKMNAELAGSTNIKAGQKIVVSESYNKPTAPAAKSVSAKVHTVGKGETLYGICKKYGVTVAELKQWNSLHDMNLKMGQKLVVNKMNQMALYKPMAVPSTPDTPYREEDIRPRASAIIPNANPVTPLSDEPVAVNTPAATVAKPVFLTEGLRTSSSNSAEYPGIFNQYSSHGYRIKKNKGAANYLADETGGNQNLAFYSEAETGSVIRVTNLMNKRTVFVKVVGKVPPTDAGNEITIKLSNKAAQDLGAIDEKFLVEVASFSSN
ncbi:MAG: LysM peptidoglycan-binding domain-containing protein [Chitinophagales bacterium]|nr:LysM peptidoglycan-binding domain-containing protein [Chitinophagales bacterium]